MSQYNSTNNYSPVLCNMKTWHEVLLIGGASVLLYCLFLLIKLNESSTYFISQIFFYATVICNHPHFMASYQILYWDQRRDILKKKKHMWAAVMVPALLIGILLGASYYKSNQLLGIFVQFMFFTVGWHYIKQVYGTIIVTTVRRKIFLSKKLRTLLLVNLYSIWGLSFINGNLNSGTADFYGIKYSLYNIPKIYLNISYLILTLSLLAVMFIGSKEFFNKKRFPPFSAIASFGAIYIWYLPFSYHPQFYYSVPFFHCLQYLLFVFEIKKSEPVQISIDATNNTTGFFHRNKKLIYFFSISVMTGVLFFNIIPNWLNQYFTEQKVWPTNYSPLAFTAIIYSFINIHHYFIDNVIWKYENPSVRKYLCHAEN